MPKPNGKDAENLAETHASLLATAKLLLKNLAT